MESQLNYYDGYSKIQEMDRNNSPAKEILPFFEGHQLIGDSLFLRFSNEVLKQPNKIVNGVRSAGYCVSGQRIDQLRQRIKKKEYELAQRVMVLIGTNDVLCGGDTDTMIRHFKRLLKLLLKNVKKLVILTLPPIPKFCVSQSHWWVIRTYNSYLKGLDNGSNILVFDICQLFTKFTGVFKLPITDPNPCVGIKSLSSERKLDSPVSSRSRSSSGSLERNKSPLKIPVERPFESSKHKQLHALLNRVHRSRKPGEAKPAEETTLVEEPKCTEQPKKLKANRKAQIVDVDSSSSDSDKEMNDLTLCEKPPDVSSLELEEKKEPEEDVPAVKKGIKRKIWIDARNDNGNVAFNNNDDESLSDEGGPCTKKRKVEMSDPESSSPSRAQRKLINSVTAGASIFSKALKGIGDQTKKSESKNVSPKRLSPDYLSKISPTKADLKEKTMKIEEEEEEAEKKLIIATTKWDVEACEETIEDIIYHSQEEEEVREEDIDLYDDEEVEKTAWLRKAFQKKLSRQTFEKYLCQLTFADYLNINNELDSLDFKRQEKEKIKFENNNNVNNINLFKGEEVVEEDIIQDEIAENEEVVEDVIVERKNNIRTVVVDEKEVGNKMTDDISEGEIFDDNDYDDGYSLEAEAESETSDDQSQKKQLWPIIDFQFANYIKQTLNLTCTIEGSSENILRNDYLKQSYNFEAPIPAQRLSMEYYSPLAASPLNSCYRNSPYLSYNTPPNSAPPTPPPMPPPIYERNLRGDESSLISKSDLEGLNPRDRNIIELSKHIVDLSCYEIIYSFGQKRMDMIHLNYTGLTRLKEFISNRINRY